MTAWTTPSSVTLYGRDPFSSNLILASTRSIATLVGPLDTTNHRPLGEDAVNVRSSPGGT
nr:hypothetical protein GCM10017745_37570 [Saccharothrix mutabilis subsp. capreolus]